MILSIIIPVYNEKNTILKILEKIKTAALKEIGFEKEIIIVDDNSTDGTKDLLKGLEGEYRIIYHQSNQGKSSAIRTGLGEVKGEYTIIQDADLEYDPQDYEKLLRCALANQAKVVYGSRQLNSENRYSHRSFYLGGIFLTRLANFIYGMSITDEATGYKLFQTEFIKSIPLRSKRFDFCPEITAKTAKRGVKIYEVPIHYYPRHKNEGKKIKWQDGLSALWALVKYRFVD